MCIRNVEQTTFFVSVSKMIEPCQNDHVERLKYGDSFFKNVSWQNNQIPIEKIETKLTKN